MATAQIDKKTNSIKKRLQHMTKKSIIRTRTPNKNPQKKIKRGYKNRQKVQKGDQKSVKK